MIRNIRHTGIVVEDLETSMCFYRDLLGFQVKKQMEESGSFINTILDLERVAVTTVKMAAPDGQMIELLKFKTHPSRKSARSINDIGITHIAFTVDDIDRKYQQLAGAGISFVSPPQTSRDGLARVTFCRAPEGTFIELVEELDCR